MGMGTVLIPVDLSEEVNFDCYIDPHHSETLCLFARGALQGEAASIVEAHLSLCSSCKREHEENKKALAAREAIDRGLKTDPLRTTRDLVNLSAELNPGQDEYLFTGIPEEYKNLP